MTKTSPDQDKTENLKTQTRQKWDSGQKRDTFETKVGQNWDKMRTVDKNETKVGIPTLTRSTVNWTVLLLIIFFRWQRSYSIDRFGPIGMDEMATEVDQVQSELDMLEAEG